MYEIVLPNGDACKVFIADDAQPVLPENVTVDDGIYPVFGERRVIVARISVKNGVAMFQADVTDADYAEVMEAAVRHGIPT